MARKSAVLTPEGKKEALAQLGNTAKEAKIVVKQAKNAAKELETMKARVTKVYVSEQKNYDKNIIKAQKELARAEAKLEVATKSLAELKATEAVKPPKPAKVQTAPVVQAAATTVQ